MKKDFDTIQSAIDQFRDGRMVIVVDDEDRENEGDFIIASEKVSPADINFMMKEGKGLICISVPSSISNKLNLIPMAASNTSLHETHFTISVDAVRNTTTGISARDRWETVKVIIDENSKPEDLGRPGHMFPLISKEGGVLQRAGHTEAGTDLARLAGLKPSAMLVEIIDDDGSMARREKLLQIAEKFNLPIITIADLIQFRRKNEKLVDKLTTIPFPTKFGDFTLMLFEDRIHGDHHVALTKGEFDETDELLVRVHSQCLTGDLFGSLRCDCGDQLQNALSQINDHGKGVLVYLRQEGRGIGLKNKIKAYQLQDEGLDTVEANHRLGFDADLREYGIGAQILLECGVKKMKLLTNNPRKIIGLEGYGLEICGRVPIEILANDVNKKYLSTKREKLGHLILDDLKDNND
ncbi:MAG: bifunctional 3,4-dihydroxy-2-butanone-4-phosphate synthase/GTP cyclohydrolase II [Candidatus Marinimicrobia bacterium]|jgi:3,4-dihydroxy 2-butanone 4-phosphate synthase/GTP cyclohydrolase II|nr:bifunctional 3,4-dihydroxy-2-butanone-4-phosphate synthase/GTP cyclohydrolase II [Candidatus Neomarinimicrobiota bacterium]MBT3634350.1 bifunctional 3,4-dihydroxy-2-butanone-4-phosphate synthase/GTP cyclohydrolase II [Candidatus Neomarinimicrobiota bacterium]MBT3681741.1 bifunctional 3,4-dihydroxy-2-butanone-4-phosphate synthase/GTP cyclohydrolase II [Candidatus Neomarinimicrobiota bacterium]MBT3759467.1 bifunctional 3,4-dihydroxy-2-butanone-4-phosphate synthase/GTP cyclohydrolase II [Candida